VHGIPEKYEFCLACGFPGPHGRRCGDCGTAVEIAPPTEIQIGLIASRVPPKGGVAPATLIYRHPSGFVEIMDAAGRTSPSVDSGPEVHDVIHGVEVVRSFGAALAWAMSEVLNMAPSNFPQVYRDVFARNLSGLSEVRRAAIELARAGLVDFLPHLALTSTERRWWTSLALIRIGEFHLALEHLEGLPAGRYPIRVLLIPVLEKELGITRSKREPVPVVGDLTAASVTTLAEFRYLARLAHMDAQSIEQLAMNRLPSASLQYGALKTPVSLQVMEEARTRQSIDGSLRLPTRMSASLIDDLIDARVEMSVEVFDSLDAELRTYFIARLDPSMLRDDEVEALGLSDERQRRRAVDGDVNDLVDLPGLPEEIRLKALFARDQVITSEMRESLPQWVTDLEEFVSPKSGSRNLTPRLLADGFLWDYLAEALGPAVLETTTSQDFRVRRFLGWASLKRAMVYLHENQTEMAIEAAKSVLKHATTEDVRDEAMNIIACAHWLSGRDSEAVAALQNALQGQRNPSLQVNLGVVASTADPEIAALELARLVAEADSLELRSNAAVRAAGIWLQDENPWKSEEQSGIPPQIRDALRSMVVEPITIQTFAVIAKVLAFQDSEWFADNTNYRQSPHFSTVEARVLGARASGLDEYVKAISRELANSPTSAWLVEERDTFVTGAIRDAFANPDLGAGFFLFEAVHNGLPVIDRHKIVLVPLGVMEMCTMISTDRGEPDDRFFAGLLATQNQFKGSELMDEWQELYEESWRRLTLTHSACAHGLLTKLAEIHDNGVQQLSHLAPGAVSKDAIISFFRPIVDDAVSIERSLRRFVGRSADPATGETLKTIIGFAVELKSMCQQNMS